MGLGKGEEMTLREDYNRDGYVIKTIWDLPDLKKSAEESDGLFLCLRKIIEKDEYRYISYLRNVLSKSISPQKMLLDDSVIKVMRDITGLTPIITTSPVIHILSPDLRISDGYYGTEAHQDWPSTQGSLNCITVWIPLTDASIGNFPLEVIPGSHKRGLLDGKMNGSVLEVEADDKEFVPIECKAGDVVFLSGFLVHRTGSGTGFRVAVSQRFDNTSEPTFIERGYPCAQKRIVDREIRWKPTVEQVVGVYE